MRRTTILAGLLLLLSLNACIDARRPYFGLPLDSPPDSGVAMFYPEILATALNERDTAIDPDNERLIYTVWESGRGTLVSLESTDRGWTGPEILPFSGTYSDLEPAFDPNGGWLYFVSNRPRDGEPRGDYDLYRISFGTDGWGEPERLPESVNGPGNQFYPSVAFDGSLYFTAELESGMGGEDIVVAEPDGEGGYSDPVPLPEEINTAGGEFNAFIAPDESYLLFGSAGRDDAIGGGDIYIARRDTSGSWLPSEVLPPPVNTERLDFCPFVTTDGELFFFTSSRVGDAVSDPFTSYEQMRKILLGGGNGRADLYWSKASEVLK
jgi:Tol biopolymer transport system component